MSHQHGPGEPTCRQVFDLLSDFVDGELSPQERQALQHHLECCPPCEEFMKTFQTARTLCRESLVEKMPGELKDRLRSFLRDHILKK